MSTRDTRRQPPFGFNVIGFITGNLGLAVACRNTLNMLSARDQPLCVVDVDAGGGRSGHDLDHLHLECEAKPPPFAVNLIHMNPPEAVNAMIDDRRAFDPVMRLTGCVPFWELPRLSEKYWVPMLESVDVVLAPTRHVLDAVERSCSGARVVHYPQAVFLPKNVRPDRARWGIPEGDVAFLMVLDVASDVARKNPMATLEAFRAAFPPGGDTRARLVVKLNNARMSRSVGKDTDSLVRSLAADPRLTVVEETMSYADVLSLSASCDAYVSLHRAEGLGLNIMEAMSLGKPVVATGWSGNLDYMTKANSCLIDYTLVPVVSSHPSYAPAMIGEGQTWAEPDVDSAARWMRALAEDEGLRTRLGEAARRTMDDARAAFLRGTMVDFMQDLWESGEAASEGHGRRVDRLLQLRKISPYRMARRRVGRFLRKTGLYQ